MSELNSKMELLGSAPVPKALMSLGVPIMIGMLINALYNLVDAYFVGGLGESPMGAISIVFPLGQVVVGLGLMFGNGAASYLSRLLGRGDRESANKAASTALYSSVIIGAVIIILATVFIQPILTLLGATDTIMPYALTYARIYVISCIFNVFNVTMNNVAASEGAAKTTMCALLSGTILNIGLDPVFIYVLGMGIAGAAIATAISQFVSTLVYLTYVLRKKSAFTFSFKDFKPSKQIYTEILKIGVPTLMFQLFTSLSITLINRAANGYGDAVIAGMGAVTRITSMGTLVVFGFLKGFSFFLFGFYTVYSSLFLALGKGTAGFILGACRQGICFIPVIFILPVIWGMGGILYAQPVADVISAIITVFMALHLHSELAKEDGF